MAEFTSFRNNALPYPVYGLPYVVAFPLLDADGDPISPSSQDSEISKNGDTFADCTNEAVEIAASSGSCYLSLTGTELTTDCAVVQIKSTGAKTTVLTLYPRKLVTIRTGTSASGGVSTSTIVLDGSASAVDDFYNGMIVAAVIDSVTEVRMITDYTGSTQTATVTPDWNTAPDNNDTFTVYLPDGVQIQQANVTHAAGTAWNSGAIGASTLASDTIAAAKIAAGAITAAKFAAGAIDAAAIANGAIDAATFAADVDAEILSYLVDDATRIDASALNTASVAVGSNGSGLTEAGGDGDHLTAINLPDQTMNITGNITGNLSGSVGSVTGAVGSVTGTVGGMTAAGWATAFTVDTTKTYADAVAGSVVKEIADNAGGASLTVQDIVDGILDEAIAGHVDAGSVGERIERLDIIASGGAGGLTNARAVLLDNLDAAVSTRLAIASYTAPDNSSIASILTDTNELQTDWTNGGRLDLLIDAIKAKTDQLTFGVSNVLNANITYVNEVEVGGSGTTASPWGPA